MNQILVSVAVHFPIKMTNLISLNDFPGELLLVIFKFLPIRDRIRFRRVSVRWSKIILTNISELRLIFFNQISVQERNSKWDQIDSFFTIKFPHDYVDLKKGGIVTCLINLAGKSLRKFVLEKQLSVHTNKLMIRWHHFRLSCWACTGLSQIFASIATCIQSWRNQRKRFVCGGNSAKNYFPTVLECIANGGRRIERSFVSRGHNFELIHSTKLSFKIIRFHGNSRSTGC